MRYNKSSTINDKIVRFMQWAIIDSMIITTAFIVAFSARSLTTDLSANRSMAFVIFAIGLMITAGMMVGTLFTLFVIPVFYLPLTRKGKAASATKENEVALPKPQTL